MNKPNKKTIEQTEIQNAMVEFKVHLNGAVESLAKAAKVYADIIAKYGDTAGKAFRKEFPAISQVTWDKLLRVAAGKMIPEIILLSDRVGKRFEKKSIEVQTKAFGGKKLIRLVDEKGHIVDKPISSLPDKDADVVFTPEGETRTLEEQLEIRKRQNAKTADYEVCGNVLIVRRATRIGKEELVRILDEMK